MRIEGPYQHRGGWRCRLASEGRRVWCPVCPTPQDATAAADLAAESARRQGALTIGEAAAAHLEHLRQGGARLSYTLTQASSVRRFFGIRIDEPLSKLTPAVCAALYDQIRMQPSKRGRAPSAATHHTYLKGAQALTRFCVAQGWLKVDPLAKLKPIGRRPRGKAQLRIDEAKAFFRTCLKQARAGDPGASAVLVALLMAFRAGEIVSRTVRDLDDGGRFLWVDDTESFVSKTDGSRRPVEVPRILRPLLHEVARGKIGGALLWSHPDGRPYRADWVNSNVHRLCALAGVPSVCAHSLRGLQATTALQAGATPELVASVLGHESVSMTLGHYAARGSKEASDSVARLRVLGADEDDA